MAAVVILAGDEFKLQVNKLTIRQSNGWFCWLFFLQAALKGTFADPAMGARAESNEIFQ